MASVTIDSLEATRRLQANGFTEQQIEVVFKALEKIQDRPATKADLLASENRIVLNLSIIIGTIAAVAVILLKMPR